MYPSVPFQVLPSDNIIKNIKDIIGKATWTVYTTGIGQMSANTMYQVFSTLYSSPELIFTDVIPVKAQDNCVGYGDTPIPWCKINTSEMKQVKQPTISIDDYLGRTLNEWEIVKFIPGLLPRKETGKLPLQCTEYTRFYLFVTDRDKANKVLHDSLGDIEARLCYNSALSVIVLDLSQPVEENILDGIISKVINILQSDVPAMPIFTQLFPVVYQIDNNAVEISMVASIPFIVSSIDESGQAQNIDEQLLLSKRVDRLLRS